MSNFDDESNWRSSYHVNTRISRELCELLLIKHDLKGSLDSLILWSQMWNDKPRPTTTKVICDSLFRDSIVQFVACFEKTAFPLSVDQVYGSAPGAKQYFNWLKGLRNSYAAHRYGAARQCIVGVMADEVSGYSGLLPAVMLYNGPQKQGHDDLKSFVNIAYEYASRRVEALQEDYDKELKGMPLEKIMACPKATFEALDAEAVYSTSRGDLLRGRKGRQ